MWPENFHGLGVSVSLSDITNSDVILDAKRHIYTLDDNMWNLKGRFTVAEEEDEEIRWTQAANGEHVAHLLAVSLGFENYIKLFIYVIL